MAPILAFFGFGFVELMVIAIVALLVFGGELPSAMRTMGRAYAKFRQGLMEMSRPMRDELNRVVQPPATPPRYSSTPDATPERPIGPSAIREIGDTGTPRAPTPRTPGPHSAVSDEPPPV